ncbi:nucleoside hydrolase [Glaciecola sp. KUL10]|uniref:nucleoside hydrolase n=1 Tax=Glaciecola sp. (strain KUL10) TaxID=2161813 RepID=UPI000D783CB3|nr:nucleoside hydrolase [Glaciecola sp. KUL10]GBL05652.1 inosine-uridine nucleoside N-ribohydrolase [Glaciecola sp. KUL10]
MAHKIILDTDPGIDDAMAIFFAFQHPDIEVLGLTTVFGNVPVDMSAQNALALCELAKVDIPVTKGVARPWIGAESTYAHFVHGDDGFGNINHPAPKGKLDPRSAAQFIVDTVKANPGEVTIVAVGPLGNLALALRLEPALPKLVKSVNIMGGAAFVPGNVTPVAEANIWNDAHAADIVFSADWQINMFGLDVTYDLPFPPNFVDILAEKNAVLGDFVQRSSQFYMSFYSEGKDTQQCYFHDAFPLAYLTNPELFQMTDGNMRISTDELNKGQTVFAPFGTTTSSLWTEAKSAKVATKVDHPELTKLFIDTYAL